MSTLNDSILHLYKMIEDEREQVRYFAKQEKQEGDMEKYNYYHGQESGFNYVINHMKKIIEYYKLKGCKTTARKTTTVKKTTVKRR